ncbi:hypothetical protein [Rhizobacter sp. LjRoot28]|uniref:hypothetical protein n=1 Tax=Rhizobacter sp. LjRoot28 TaxID=3342309 RepID=UPI003ECF6923
MPHLSIRLPYGIVIKRDSRVCTHITSELRAEFVDPSKDFDSHGELAAHAMESLLVALVTEGIDIGTPAASAALTAAAEAIAEYLVRLED